MMSTCWCRWGKRRGGRASKHLAEQVLHLLDALGAKLVHDAREHILNLCTRGGT